MKPSKIYITDTIGQKFTLSQCSWLCWAMGDMDYSNPVMIVYPDGTTPMWIEEVDLRDRRNRSVDLDDIEWEHEK